MSEPQSLAATPPTGIKIDLDISRALVLLMAISVGLAVASIYYSQPMLGALASQMQVSESGIGWVPTITQIGYALGILLLAPLGDRFDRKQIILLKGVLLALALFAFGAGMQLSHLLLASFVIGMAATMAQDIVPAAATLAPEAKKGQVVGTVMTGLLLGILLSRVVSGFIADYLGWRYVFIAAGVAMSLVVVAIAKGLPSFKPTSQLSYAKLLMSLLHLLKQYPSLSAAALTQGLLSAGFSGFWSTLAVMLHGAPFHFGSAIAGAFGLAGAAGALAAPIAGKLADRSGPQKVTEVGAILTAISFIFMMGSVFVSPAIALWILVIGAVGFDMGVQVTMIGHQSIVYRLDARARSRLNAVLLTGMFIGMSAGAAIGAYLLGHFGWLAVTIFGAICGGLAWLVRLRQR
ncbi:MFS transporter [Leeia sp. TBRC 13508]|uniref:MFS transporter n=1 Tax=Leeia speluncae TaxID=2884804 RepID=A0ABS8D1I6_9NEIS|nr:MFS transporter [Leeia speluncae]MCB6182055.1 MFS transporter [Leeia speluncae]